MNAATDIAWNIACTLDCERWLADLPEAEAICRRAAMAALDAALDAALGAGEIGPGEICIVLADDNLVRELNRRYRGFDRATNVLAFPMTEAETKPDDGPFGPPSLLGDVVVALDTTAREAAEQDKRLGDHLSHLVVHGTLHLLGYDHEIGEAASRMERLETEALAGLGVADPYAAKSEPEAAEPASVGP